MATKEKTCGEEAAGAAAASLHASREHAGRSRMECRAGTGGIGGGWGVGPRHTCRPICNQRALGIPHNNPTRELLLNRDGIREQELDLVVRHCGPCALSAPPVVKPQNSSTLLPLSGWWISDFTSCSATGSSSSSFCVTRRERDGEMLSFRFFLR